MAKLSILAGSTSVSVPIFMQNSSSTTGAGLTGFATAGGALLTGMKFYYSFLGTNAASVVQTLSVPATVGAAFAAGNIVEIDATNMPGIARLDLPNAMLAAAKGRTVVAMIQGGTNVAPLVLEIELTGVDNQAASYGLTLAKTTNITGFNDLSSASVTTAATAATPTAAAVTGAVGSVTGNVGGNVVGSVGSVTGLTASDVAAIKAKTDQLAFTVAGQVDANAKSMNATTILGNGTSGNLWRG